MRHTQESERECFHLPLRKTTLKAFFLAFLVLEYQVWKLLNMVRKQLFHGVKVFNKSTQKGFNESVQRASWNTFKMRHLLRDIKASCINSDRAAMSSWFPSFCYFYCATEKVRMTRLEHNKSQPHFIISFCFLSIILNINSSLVDT